MDYCFKRDCKVIVKPQEKGKNPDTKLIMSMQGTNKVGNKIYKQDAEMWEKVHEMYLYMYKRLVS